MQQDIVEKIAAFLRERQTATSVALAEHFLKLARIDAVVADRLVSALLAPHQIFYQKTPGQWALHETTAPPQLSFVICKVFPETTARARIYTIHLAQFHDGDFGQTQEKRLNYSPQNLRQTAIDIAAFIGSSPVVFDGFGNQRSNLYWLLAQAGLLENIGPVFSLAAIAKKLFPNSRCETPDDLSALLLGQFQTGEPVVQFNNFKDQVRTLVDHLKENGIQTAAAMREFLAAETGAPDFTRYAFGPEAIQNLPDKPGVYVMTNVSGDVIYVGKAKILSRRLRSYFTATSQLDEKLALIWDDLNDLEIIETGSELEALLLEHELIQKYQPPINTQFEVHLRQQLARERFPRILFLPAAEEATVKVLLYAPEKGVRLLAVAAAADNVHELEPHIDELFWQPANQLDEKQRAAIEIVTSWLSLNNTLVSGIDMRQVATTAEALRLVRDHVRFFDPGQAQVFC